MTKKAEKGVAVIEAALETMPANPGRLSHARWER